MSSTIPVCATFGAALELARSAGTDTLVFIHGNRHVKPGQWIVYPDGRFVRFKHCASPHEVTQSNDTTTGRMPCGVKG